MGGGAGVLRGARRGGGGGNWQQGGAGLIRCANSSPPALPCPARCPPRRDIKPQNLLVNINSHALKLCDFGSAKMLVAGEANISYICSRYYRAPELIFGATNYTCAIDVSLLAWGAQRLLCGRGACRRGGVDAGGGGAKLYAIQPGSCSCEPLLVSAG